MREFISVTKALSDETRVRALLAVREGELCLCQIIEVLGLAPSTVSKHMNLLQQAGLIQRRKQGKWHFYRLAQPRAGSTARRGLDFALQSLDAAPALRDDARRVRQVRRRDLGELSACYR